MCVSFVEVNYLRSSRRIVVMCKIELGKILRGDLTAAQRIVEGESRLTCMLYFFGINVFIFLARTGCRLDRFPFRNA